METNQPYRNVNQTPQGQPNSAPRPQAPYPNQSNQPNGRYPAGQVPPRAAVPVAAPGQRGGAPQPQKPKKPRNPRTKLIVFGVLTL